MPRKNKTSSRRKGKSNDNDGDGGMDALSETHTVASIMSEWDSSMMASADDDGIHTGDGAVENMDDLQRLNGGGMSEDDAAELYQARMNRLVDALTPLDELTTEKRSARREASLKRAFNAISQWATGAAGQSVVYERFLECIISACKYSLRQGAPSEQYASCRVLEVTAIVIGADHHTDYYDAIYTLLSRVLHSKQRAVPVRMAAFRTMAISCFINAEDDVATEQVMDLAEEFAKEEHRGETVPKSLRATSLQVWALLSTAVEDNYIAGKDDVSIGRGLVLLPLLQQCLEDTTDQASSSSSGGASSGATSLRLSLRAAAGQCLVVIHESRMQLGLQEENQIGSRNGGDDDDGDGTKQNADGSDAGGVSIGVSNLNQYENPSHNDAKFQQGSWESTEWEIIIDEMSARIAELAVESSHHISKKAKKELRAIFREYQTTLIDNELPTPEVVHFRGGSLELTTWKEIVQLDFIRHALQGGFQAQLLTNGTLQLIFGLSANIVSQQANYGQGYSQLEKRLLLSKTSEASKMADQERIKKRRQRHNVKNHFLTVDGEDI